VSPSYQTGIGSSTHFLENFHYRRFLSFPQPQPLTAIRPNQSLVFCKARKNSKKSLLSPGDLLKCRPVQRRAHLIWGAPWQKGMNLTTTARLSHWPGEHVERPLTDP
jgi:hypothetical protein